MNNPHERPLPGEDELTLRVHAADGDLRKALDAELRRQPPNDTECAVLMLTLLRARGLMP